VCDAVQARHPDGHRSANDPFPWPSVTDRARLTRRGDRPTLAPVHPAPEPLPPVPSAGRRFVQERTVELSDVTVDDRMRLDAVARWLQDIAMADVRAAGLHEPAWIVRRTLVRVARFPRYLERVAVTTFCWSMGRFAAERRTTLEGEHGSKVDTLTLWIRLDPSTGRPAPLTDAFRACYEEVCAGRRTDHALRHPDPPASGRRAPWPLRATDFDLRGHVNNAACWAAVEEALARDGLLPRSSFEMEFRAAIPPGTQLELLQPDGTGGALWLVGGDQAFASAFCWV